MLRPFPADVIHMALDRAVTAATKRATWSRVVVGNVAFGGAPVDRTLLVSTDYTVMEVTTAALDSALELSAHFYDSRGLARAYLRRNAWDFEQDGYDAIITPRRVMVRNHAGHDTVLDVARLPDDCTLVIRGAHLFTPNGLRILVDEETGITIADSFKLQTLYSAEGSTELRALGCIKLDGDGAR